MGGRGSGGERLFVIRDVKDVRCAIYHMDVGGLNGESGFTCCLRRGWMVEKWLSSGLE